MFRLPTMSRWPANRHWGFLHTQFRPRTFWRRWQPGFGVLELAPASRAFGAARLLALQLTQALIVAALEAADAPPTDEEGFAAGRGHRRQVDFAQIDGGLSCSRSLCGHRGWHQHMQLVAPVPDEGDRPDAFGQVQAEAQ